MKQSRATDASNDLTLVITSDMTAKEAMDRWVRYLQRKNSIRPVNNRFRRSRAARKLNQEAAEILESVMNALPSSKTRHGRIDAVIEGCLIEAAKGDLSSAEMIIDMYHYSKKHGDFEVPEPADV